MLFPAVVGRDVVLVVEVIDERTVGVKARRNAPGGPHPKRWFCNSSNLSAKNPGREVDAFWMAG